MTQKQLKAPKSLPILGAMTLYEGECSYFPERKSKTAYSFPKNLEENEYKKAMDLGMRRSGQTVYKPLCKDCRQCIPIRVPIGDFIPSKSQKRIWKKNQYKWTVTLGKPCFDLAHVELYEKYQAFQHQKTTNNKIKKEVKTLEEQAASYYGFLIESMTNTLELNWWDENDELVAVSTLDFVENAISSVYFYWHPKLASTSIGTYSSLFEIELCKQQQKDYYYLGYYIAECKSMNYKAQYKGAELWNGIGWEKLRDRDPKSIVQKQQIQRIAQQIINNDFRIL